MPSRPNILFILADDMGFSDIGCFGAEMDPGTRRSLAARAGSADHCTFRVPLLDFQQCPQQ